MRLRSEDYEWMADQAQIGGLDRAALRLVLVDGIEDDQLGAALEVRQDIARQALAGARVALSQHQWSPSAAQAYEELLRLIRNSTGGADHVQYGEDRYDGQVRPSSGMAARVITGDDLATAEKWREKLAGPIGNQRRIEQMDDPRRPRKRMSAAKAKQLVDDWNAKHPVGTPVRYWSGLRQGEGTLSETRERASVVGGQPVVWVRGCLSCVALSHVQAVEGGKG
jgi:hypothetical protein